MGSIEFDKRSNKRRTTVKASEDGKQISVGTRGGRRSTLPSLRNYSTIDKYLDTVMSDWT